MVFAPLLSGLASTAGRIAGSSLLGAGIGYVTSPDDRKTEGALQGGLLGGIAGGVAPIAGRLASGLKPMELIKDAYTGPQALFNIGLDALPIALDASTGNLSPASFLGPVGTLAGTAVGGRTLNRLGMQQQKEVTSDFWKMTKGNDDFYQGAKGLGKNYKNNQAMLDDTLNTNSKEIMADPLRKNLTRRDSNFAVDIGVNIIGSQLLAAPPKNLPDSNPLTTYEQYSKYYGQ
jgi:hypothetical protein